MGGIKIINDKVARMKQDPSWNYIFDGARSVASGAAFGAALTAAGVHMPDVIVQQFRLTDFRMFQVFSVALGSSVFVILACDKLNIATRQVRPNTPLGLFSRYDGNIIGGALVGLGMSLSGSCPGTVTAQLAQGVPTAGVTAVGGVLGGMAHLWITKPTRSHKRTRSKVSPSRSINTAPLQYTITSATGLHESIIYVLMGVVLTSLLSLSVLTSTPFWRSPAAGGLYLGSAQLISILSTSSALGSSGIYDQAGRYIWRLLGDKSIAPAPTPPKSLLFAAGAIAGSAVLSRIVPSLQVTSTAGLLSTASAFAGGFIMVFGAKTAKGCTSGHGLSGMGALSFPSLITVASMFGAGIAYQFI